MSLTRSRRASSITRLATSLLPLLAACSTKVVPPTASIATPAAVHLGIPVQLDGTTSASTRAGATLTYAWSFNALPPLSQAKLNDPKLAAPSFLPDVAGTYVVQLIVDDGILSAATSVTLAAADDCRPAVATFTGAPERPDVGQVEAISVTVTPGCGAGATLVAYQWTLAQAPSGSHAQLALATTPHPSFIPDVRGDYDITLVVTDSTGLSSALNAAAHFHVSSQPCGDNSPVVGAITATPTTPDALAQVTLAAPVTDADLDTCGLPRSLSYQWQILSEPAGSLAALNNATVKSPSFTPDLHGDYKVGLTVTDDLGRASARQTLTITTTGCGDAVPTAAALFNPASPNTGQTVQLHTQVADSDNANYDGIDQAGGPATTGGTGCNLALTYAYRWQLIRAPQGSKAALNNSALANPSFVADVTGTYVAQVVAIASTGHASAPSLATITAQGCGGLPLPSLSVVATAAKLGTGEPVQLSIPSTYIDPNAGCEPVASPFQYAWSVISAPAGSTAALSGTNASGVSAQATPSFTPDVGSATPYVIGLTLTDSFGLSASASATFVAGACNQPLQATLGYTIQPLSADGGVAVDGGAAETGSAITVFAQVTDANDPATATTCSAGVAPFSYSWSLVGQPSGSAAQLNSSTSATPSFSGDLPGTYTVQLVVADAAGNKSAPQTESIALGSCTAPVTIGSIAVPATVVTGQPVLLGATVVDPNQTLPDGGPNSVCTGSYLPLSYAWTLVAQPSGSKATLNNPTAAAPSLVPDVGGAGQYVVQLVVTDAAGNRSAPLQQSFTASICNAAPTIPAAGIVFTSADPTGLFVAGAAITASVALPGPGDTNTAAGCPAVTPFSYSWQLVGQPTGSKAALNNRAAAAPSFVPDVLTTSTTPYVIQLTLTDAAGNKSATFTANQSVTQSCTNALVLGAFTTVAHLGGAIQVNTLLDTAVAAGDQNLAANCGAGSLPDGGVSPALGWSWLLVARPSGSKASIVDPTAAIAQVLPDLAGDYVLFAKATDSFGNSGSASTTIVVNACGMNSGVTPAASVSSAAPEVGQGVTLSSTVADANASCGMGPAPYSYVWSLTAPSGSFATLGNARAASTTFTPDKPGVYSATVTVTDSLGFTATSAAVTATAATCTFSPTVMVNTLANGGGSLYLLNTRVSLTASAGAACSNYAFAWAFDALPAGSLASFNGPNAVTTGFNLDASDGKWALHVTATDLATGVSLSSTPTILSTTPCGGSSANIASNQYGVQTRTPNPPATPPLVAIASPHKTLPTSKDNNGVIINVNDTLQLFASAFNSNTACGGVLSYAWSIYALPPGSNASINPPTAAFPVVKVDTAGDYIFEVIVSDGIAPPAGYFMWLHVQ